MTKQNKFLTYTLLLLFTFSIVGFTAATTRANDRAFTVVAAHLKTRYRAKQRRIPFLGLANLAMKLARPAGVKSFKVMIFEDLHEATFASGAELNNILRGALDQHWQPLVRIYSKQNNEQTYVYVASEGKSIKLMIVALQPTEATLVRVKVNPDALVKFMDNPKILGISLASNQH